MSFVLHPGKNPGSNLLTEQALRNIETSKGIEVERNDPGRNRQPVLLNGPEVWVGDKEVANVLNKAAGI